MLLMVDKKIVHYVKVIIFANAYRFLGLTYRSVRLGELLGCDPFLFGSRKIYHIRKV